MENKINYFALVLGGWMGVLGAQAHANTPKCVRIYYDAQKAIQYKTGKIYSIFLQNLLGHFPEYQQLIAPIESYKKGDANLCDATLYLGSYFENAIPDAFLEDYATTSKNIAWLGYSIWKLGNEKLRALFGYEYAGLTVLDKARRDPRNRPTFYKNVHYKGEVFYKYGEFSTQNPDEFMSPFEQVALKKTAENPETQILSFATHNGTGEPLPYILRNKNHFYVADIPFSYIHDSDRYLVLSDLLFDILGASPRYPGKKPAVFRVEDVHACAPLNGLKATLQAAKTFPIPLQIALVPVFKNPLLESEDCRDVPYRPITESPDVLNLLREIKDQGATFLWHGVTHQYERLRNPVNAATGDDYEFWDSTKNAPVPEDSVPWVLNRLDLGWKTLTEAGFAPQIWETPHYQASMLDYHLFSRVFSWTIGTLMYAPHTVSGLPPQRNDALWYEKSGLKGSDLRKETLKNITAVAVSTDINGQFYPYEIYGDLYGNRIIPENMGFIAPYQEKQISIRARIEHLMEIAKRNRVLRDVWASFYFHPYHLETLLQSKQSEEPLKNLIRSIQESAYEFVNLNQFIENRKSIQRPEPIYTDADQETD